MAIHKDAIVQLTRDVQMRRGLLIKRGAPAASYPESPFTAQAWFSSRSTGRRS
jgi:hypothetical protein